MFQPFKDFHLVGVLTLAFIFQPAGQLIFVPTGMFDAQAQETREKKEKPKGKRKGGSENLKRNNDISIHDSSSLVLVR